jgi:hypothetical protein
MSHLHRLLTREQVLEYRKELFNSQYNPSGLALQAILDNELEVCKNSLIAARGEDIPILQGEAKAYKKLLSILSIADRAVPKS